MRFSKCWKQYCIHDASSIGFLHFACVTAYQTGTAFPPFVTLLLIIGINTICRLLYLIHETNAISKTFQYFQISWILADWILKILTLTTSMNYNTNYKYSIRHQGNIWYRLVSSCEMNPKDSQSTVHIKNSSVYLEKQLFFFQTSML